MTYSGWAYDLLLAGTLIWLAVRVLAEVRLFKAVVLYIAFGLLVAIAWVRLAAPDIALAEAAIGAGITGALLLDAAGHMRGRSAPYSTSSAQGDTAGTDDTGEVDRGEDA